ncbi:MAG: hypothetical protein Q4C18_03220 [Eubacteriales bacterium]|nr:hypothetical protein [Eubacteriales bacterium]
MKKKLAVFLLLTAMLGMCACGSKDPEVTPTKTVDTFLKAIQDEDQDAIKKVYEESSFDIGKEAWDDTDGEDDEDELDASDDSVRNVLVKDFYPRLIQFEYKMGEEKIDGDSATVTVDITTYKMGDTFVAGFKDFFSQAMDLYNSNASDEEVSKVMADSLHKKLSGLKKKEYKETATFHLSKENGKWVIDEMDDDDNEAALNALTGGMMDATNKIDKMTEK